MKTRFLLLLLPLVFSACAEIDTETAELSAYYARKGDAMTTTLQRANSPDFKKLRPPEMRPESRPKPTY